jgi:hypothetical protein
LAPHYRRPSRRRDRGPRGAGAIGADLAILNARIIDGTALRRAPPILEFG